MRLLQIAICSFLLLSSCNAQKTVYTDKNDSKENITKSTQNIEDTNSKESQENEKILLYAKDFEGVRIDANNKIEVQTFLEDHFDTHLIWENENESPLGKHYSFQQYQEFVVWDSYLKINLKKDGSIFSITGTIYDLEKLTPAFDKKTFNAIKYFETPIDAEVAELFFAQRPQSLKSIQTYQWFWKISDDRKTYQPALQIVAEDETTNKQYQFIVAENGDVLFEEELSAYHHKGHCNKHEHNHKEYIELSNNSTVSTFQIDTSAMALVYLPDPLTTANVNYGTPYSDNDDQTNPELDNERKTVEIRTDFQNGEFILENEYIKIVDIADPDFTPVTSTDGTFFFNRSQSGFEDVNAYYHLTTFQEYLQGLGFNNLCTEQAIKVDPHGTPNDNSFFRYGDQSIVFGDGGVDDAEDADVIIHEYGHAISNCAAMMTNTTGASSERNALDEAYGDYLATSYSRSLSDNNWEDMFTWDGHNEYWSGRNVASNAHYPEDLDNSIFNNSQIFSSVMMEIWEVLGRECTDKLLLSSMFLNERTTGFEEATNNILALLPEICGEDGTANFAQVYELFYNRGLIKYDIDAGEDQESICRGDTVILDATIANEPTTDLNFYWEGNDIIADANSFNPQVLANASDEYIFFVEDPYIGGVVHSDTVHIQVDHCVNLTTDLAFLNTIDFNQANKNPTLLFSENIEAFTAALVDINGRIVWDSGTQNENFIEIPSSFLPAGLYIVKVIVQTSTGNSLENSYTIVKAE